MNLSEIVQKFGNTTKAILPVVIIGGASRKVLEKLKKKKEKKNILKWD